MKDISMADLLEIEDKTIFNHHTYDPLVDFRTMDKYQYVPTIHRNNLFSRQKEFIDSDFVRKAIDLPYWFDIKGISFLKKSVRPNLGTSLIQDTEDDGNTGYKSFIKEVATAEKRR